MKKKDLLEMLDSAERIEGSSITALTQIIAFHLDRGFDFGLDPASLEEVKGHLATLRSDCGKHRRLLDEARAIVLEEVRDDF